ncbi:MULTISPECIES: PAS domain-containing sensor histidine kinase [Stenotrophomonas]|uniref:PAS domain-containing sensor histidine kinase n=1 Tax=Stenotrophomonas maltophilia TaxID=40324 RepID=UPI00209ACF6B|nr:MULTISPECIES: PAS domain-containing sensor histidine kinase [Stenotrophomonas]MCO7496899.1 PAS domain-containing sensor histidine kinase [Stenotrophomonas maltophilia]
MNISADQRFEDAACGLLWTRRDGTVLAANPTFCQWLNYDAVDIVGRTFQDLLTMGGKLFHQTHWFPLLEMQGSVTEVKLDFYNKHGQKVAMLVNARAIETKGGEIAYSIATLASRDRDRYERELLKARKVALARLDEISLLQKAASERSKFSERLVGIVSHDLRNPLSAIRMGVDILTMGETDPSRLRTSERINNSVDRALDLVENLLDFTLTESGRPIPMNLKPMELHQSVCAAVEELRWTFPKAVIQHHAAGVGAVVADSTQLTRALGNLVANANRYGDRSKAVEVRSEVEGGWARIQVVNEGPVISQELISKMFQPMERGSTDEGGGVGLGLYIVEQIARLHGGQATVSSSPRDGTCVSILFPANPQQAGGNA